VSATAKCPVITCSLILAAAVASLSPLLANWLLWDRAAIADGQWWRLLTGHLVHFTHRHLWCDVLAVGATGWFIEGRIQKSLAFVVLSAALAIDIAIAFLCPAVRYYGGLSGIAFAMCGYMALLCIHQRGGARWIGFTLVALLAGKIGLEFVTGHGLLLSEGSVVLPAVHAAGAITGGLKGAMAT
jgi:rhomboid family GlyGly-CTERM serine protease